MSLGLVSCGLGTAVGVSWFRVGHGPPVGFAVGLAFV